MARSLRAWCDCRHRHSHGCSRWFRRRDGLAKVTPTGFPSRGRSGCVLRYHSATGWRLGWADRWRCPAGRGNPEGGRSGQPTYMSIIGLNFIDNSPNPMPPLSLFPSSPLRSVKSDEHGADAVIARLAQEFREFEAVWWSRSRRHRSLGSAPAAGSPMCCRTSRRRSEGAGEGRSVGYWWRQTRIRSLHAFSAHFRRQIRRSISISIVTKRRFWASH